MISRRALRIRSFQLLFSYFKQEPQPSVEFIKKQFFQSIQKSYYFYLMTLSMLDEFRILEVNQLEKQKNKKMKTEGQSVFPVMSNHPFFTKLKESKEFYHQLTEYKVNFGKDKDWVHSIFRMLIKSDFYNEYAKKENHSNEEATNFIDTLISDFLYSNELLEHYFEEESQFAHDDLYLSLNLVSKTIDEFLKTGKIKILPMYKDENSDQLFVEKLLEYTIQNYTAFDDYIARYSKNWDLERINYSDLLLIKMCMVELIYMPEIPLKSSVDEYIEISKEYSTPQSYIFINGILVGVIKDLQEKGMINKMSS